jgi:hypothetical protein
MEREGERRKSADVSERGEVAKYRSWSMVTLYAEHFKSCANAIKNAEISVKWRLAGHASFFYPGAAHRILRLE